MKVFTVGLDEKEKAKAAEDLAETGSVVIEPKPAAQLIPPPVAVKRPSRSPFKGWLSCLLFAVLVFIIALSISEIAYNRHRDEQFLRLKWAELKQRMLGMEILRQSQLQAQHSASMQAIQNPIQNANNDMPPEVIDERLAFSKRLEKERQKQSQSVEKNNVDASSEVTNDSDETLSSSGDARLAFLRAILERIRAAAQTGQIDGPVQVSVIEVKKQPMESGERSDELNNEMPTNMADGFGEWAAPSPFGPAGPPPEEYDYDGGFQNEPVGRFAWRGDRFPPIQGNQNPEMPPPFIFNDHSDEPRNVVDASENAPFNAQPKPQLKITHHFDKDNAMAPARIVTELYGDDASELIRNLLTARVQETGDNRPFNQGSVPAGMQFPLPQQPWIQNQMAARMPHPAMEQQKFAEQFGQNFGTNFGLNWERAQNRWQGPQFFGQQQPQMPPVGPLPFQNIPQNTPFQQMGPHDFQQGIQSQPLAPWYQGQPWKPRPQTEQQLPIASDNTLKSIQEESNKQVADEEARFTDLNNEDQGDEGFERKEQFNVPVVMTDVNPETTHVEKSEEQPSQTVEQKLILQPAQAIEVQPVKEPASSAAFLPSRDNFDDPPPPKENSEPSIPSEAVSDDDSFVFDKHSPLFQVDDPRSIE